MPPETALDPQNRALYGDILRPPPGYGIDCAVATTYTHDFETALVIPATLAFHAAESRKQTLDSPLALLEGPSRVNANRPRNTRASDVTRWLGFRLRDRETGVERLVSLGAELLGLPDGHAAEILRSIVANREAFLRYLRLLLSDLSDPMSALLARGGTGTWLGGAALDEAPSSRTWSARCPATPGSCGTLSASSRGSAPESPGRTLQ